MRSSILQSMMVLCMFLSEELLLVKAMKDEQTIDLKAKSLSAVMSFGFLAGGSADWRVGRVSGTRSGRGPAPVKAMACTDPQMDVFSRFNFAVSYMCSSPKNVSDFCFQILTLDDESGAVRWQEKYFSTEMYVTLWLLNCDDERAEVSMSYTFLNKGGEHLGSNQISLKYVWLLVVVCRTILFLFWSWDFARHRSAQLQPSRSQRGVFLILAWGSFSALVHLLLWYFESWNGISVASWRIGLIASFKFSLFLLCVCISAGKERPHPAAFFAAFLCIVSTVLWMWTGASFLVLFMLMTSSICVIRICLSGLNTQVFEREREVEAMIALGFDPKGSHIMQNREIAVRMRLTICCYLLLSLLLQLSTFATLYRFPWIYESVDSGLICFMAMAHLAHLLRLRPLKSYRVKRDDFDTVSAATAEEDHFFVVVEPNEKELSLARECRKAQGIPSMGKEENAAILD